MKEPFKGSFFIESEVTHRLAYISALEKEQTYITCEIKGLDSSYSYNDRYIKWYYNGKYKGRSDLEAGITHGGEYTATGLTPDTTYDIEAKIYGKKGLIVTLEGTATTKSPPSVPKFYWTYSGARNGKPVYGSRKVSGMEFYLSAVEWNELADNIKQKLENRGMDTSQYHFGRIYAAQGEVFKASHFNYMRKAIGALSSTGLSNKARGEPIKASDLNILMDRNNEVR